MIHASRIYRLRSMMFIDLPLASRYNPSNETTGQNMFTNSRPRSRAKLSCFQFFKSFGRDSCTVSRTYFEHVNFYAFTVSVSLDGVYLTRNPRRILMSFFILINRSKWTLIKGSFFQTQHKGNCTEDILNTMVTFESVTVAHSFPTLFSSPRPLGAAPAATEISKCNCACNFLTLKTRYRN